MPNADNTFGTFNKQTKIISQIFTPGHFNEDSSTMEYNVFASVDEAKSYFFTDDALTVMDETCTVLEWALHADSDGFNTKLKTTFAFGTKGSADISESDDWAEQYNSRKTTLMDAGNWTKTLANFEDSSDHLV
jgi:hypothetical protein